MARTKTQAYPRVRRRKNPSGKISWLVDLSKNKPRERFFFKTKEDAEVFAQQKRVEYQNFGSSLGEMPDTAKAEAARLWKQLKDVGATLTEAVGFFFKHSRPDGGERLVKDAVDELLASLKKNGRSATYLQVQGSMLGQFKQALGERKVHTVMSRDIEEWIECHPDWHPRTRLNYQRSISSLWEYALRKKYATHNPVESLDKPTIDNEPPGILGVNEAAALLTAAKEKREGDMLASIAIGLFAGLRPAEIERLDWSEVNLPGRLIEVTAKKAKTRQRRHVAISDNLAAWLETIKDRAGNVAPRGKMHEKVVPLARSVGIDPWPADALRHSFASYHLAMHKDAARTALELGHRSQTMLFANYRELVKPAEAEKFWAILP
jgi:integrase